MTYNHRFDAFDTSVGKYGAHKVPKWHWHASDLLDFVHHLDFDDPFSLEGGAAAAE